MNFGVPDPNHVANFTRKINKFRFLSVIFNLQKSTQNERSIFNDRRKKLKIYDIKIKNQASIVDLPDLYFGEIYVNNSPNLKI
jgi:hypothetical protein